jgi:hypothetical protein
MKNNPVRGRRIILSALVLVSAGLVSCTAPILPAPQNTPLSPWADPPPFSWGEGEMQFVRLSRTNNALIDYTQVLVDEEGVVYLFWKEDPSGESYRSKDYRFRRRFADGSWDVEERIENSELDFNPKFLWDENRRPCYTFYNDSDSPTLGLSCMQPGGWVETSYTGYAELINHSLSLFLDPPRIVTAFFTLEGSTGILNFGKTRLFEGMGDVSGVELAHDAVGVYYMVFYVESPSPSDVRMMISESKDKGETWSDPTEITRNHGGDPKFFLAQDGTLYLAWMESRKLTVMHRSTSTDWAALEIPFDAKYDFFHEEVFLGESADGTLWIALWNENGMHTMHGTVREGFTAPIQVMSGAYPDYWASNVSVVFGRNGTFYMTGIALDKNNINAQYAVFGWV